MTEAAKKRWWSRNWKWFVPVGCLGLVLAAVGGVALLVMLVFGVVKSSDVYQQSLAQAQASAQVREALGQPTKAGLFVTGHISTSGSSGSAQLSIPISGPKGSGAIYAEATKSAGKWSFSTLQVEVFGQESRIILLPGT